MTYSVNAAPAVASEPTMRAYPCPGPEQVRQMPFTAREANLA